MATLQRIRNRAGLLIAVIIGMAIFAFVLQDMLTGGNPNTMGSRVDFAEIDGNSVKYEEYASRLEKLTEYYRLRLGQSSLDEQTMESLREQTWQDIVREYSTSNEYDELGVAVSTDELMDMVQGRNPHPVQKSYHRQMEAPRFLSPCNSTGGYSRSRYHHQPCPWPPTGTCRHHAHSPCRL